MKNIQKTIGYILLFPPLLSVLLFTINLLLKESGPIIGMNNLSANWSGWAGYSGDSGAGFTSSVPLYFGLMAIAGAYLIKNSNED
jgi:hypothetical protein